MSLSFDRTVLLCDITDHNRLVAAGRSHISQATQDPCGDPRSPDKVEQPIRMQAVLQHSPTITPSSSPARRATLHATDAKLPQTSSRPEQHHHLKLSLSPLNPRFPS